jgi:hypothetical protein
MHIFFFYDENDGSAAIGEIRDQSFLTHYSYPAGGFKKHWSAVTDMPLAGGRLLFYDLQTESGVVGLLTPEEFQGEKSYEAGSFGSWTHIAGVRVDGYGRLLFYNSATGAAAVGFDPTIITYAPGQFSPGWSHIVPSLSSDRILFYNAQTGSGAVGFDPPQQVFAPGSFAENWSQIAAAPAVDGEDVLVFYKKGDRSGALGRLGTGGFHTVSTYGPNSFGEWTHLVGFQDGFFFYDGASGAAALAVIDDEQIVTVKLWGQDSFKRGWTHILRSSNAMQFAKLEGYAWPPSAKPQEQISFKVTTAADSYSVAYIKFQNRAASEVTANTVEQSDEMIEVPFRGSQTYAGGMQIGTNSPDTGAIDWLENFKFDVPTDFPSGFYAAKLEDSEGDISYIPFIIEPADDLRADFVVIVNLSTWNCYNGWGGYNRYSVPHGGSWVFSYHRPYPLVIDPSRVDSDYHYDSKHLGRGELWVINWLRQSGYSIDLHTDLDLHEGVADLDSYKALVFSTHPEYLSNQTRDVVEEYLNHGGSLVYLGGNGFYDAVDIADDLSTLTVYGTSGTGRTHLFRQPPLLRPESALLGVAFSWSRSGGDIGNNRYSRVGYRVVQSSHPFFVGTGLSNGDVFGSSGWCIIEGSGSLDAGGASGWECDIRDSNSPASTILLGQGTNDTGTAAEMVTYDHPGGGLVFSAGSMSIQGAVPSDSAVQRILSNVLSEAKKRRA